MIQTMSQLLASAQAPQILSALETALKNTNESPFWEKRIVPLSSAILSVLIPLRDQKLLFNPEGEPQETLNAELFLRWCDLLSLKTLAFILQQSNDASKLVRTKYSDEKAQHYQVLDLSELGTYLSAQTVNLEDEYLDFPIANYNLHIGIADIIKKLL